MHPSFEQFVEALRDPAQRPGIGLSISDADASTLLTRADWANDYYSRWIALFPPIAAEPAPVLTSSASEFGPPPSAAATQGPGFVAVDAPDWGAKPRRTLPSPARIAIIAVLTVVVLAVVAGVIYEVQAVTRTPVATAAKTPAAVASPSSGASTGTNDPVVFHGLTQSEYDLMEAVLAPQGHTLEEAVQQGTTDEKLRELVTAATAETAKSCSDGEALPGGFTNAVFRASFIAGYVTGQGASQDQASDVYDALANFCANH